MLVLAFYDKNAVGAENTENVTLYLTLHYIIKFQIILIFYSIHILQLKMKDFISQFCYIYLSFSFRVINLGNNNLTKILNMLIMHNIIVHNLLANLKSWWLLLEFCYTFVYICVCVCIYMCAYIYIHVYMYIYMYICVCVCVYMYMYMYVHIYIYMCVCVCVHIYVYIYAHYLQGS